MLLFCFVAKISMIAKSRERERASEREGVYKKVSNRKMSICIDTNEQCGC